MVWAARDHNGLVSWAEARRAVESALAGSAVGGRVRPRGADAYAAQAAWDAP